jgi:hypothetical protein
MSIATIWCVWPLFTEGTTHFVLQSYRAPSNSRVGSFLLLYKARTGVISPWWRPSCTPSRGDLPNARSILSRLPFFSQPTPAELQADIPPIRLWSFYAIKFARGRVNLWKTSSTRRFFRSRRHPNDLVRRPDAAWRDYSLLNVKTLQITYALSAAL